MNWFNKMERKFGRYAIKNLMNYIIILYAFGFILELFYPKVYEFYFSLDAERLLHGEIWRAITFIMQPPTTSLIFILFSLYLYYIIGSVLERAWGSFKFNVYFFMGVIFHVLAAIIVYLVFDTVVLLNTYYLNMALYVAFAMLQPDFKLLLFGIVPIKIKWIAYLDIFYFVATIFTGFLANWLPLSILYGVYMLGVTPSPVNATAALVAMLNFVIFYLISKTNRKTQGQKAFNRAMGYDKKVFSGNATAYKPKAEDAQKGGIHFKKMAKHRCAVCSRTELDSDELEFRYCSKCEGNYEYCSEHLYTHKHVTKEDNNNVTNFSNNN